MATLTAIYSRRRSLSSALIRAADRWGQWSHCGLVVRDTYVIESVAFKGVVRTPLSQFVCRASDFAFKDIEVPDLESGLFWAEQQVGKPYDYGAVIANLLREDLDRPERMDCVEIVEGALVAAGLMRFVCPLWKLSPNLSYIVV